MDRRKVPTPGVPLSLEWSEYGRMEQLPIALRWGRQAGQWHGFGGGGAVVARRKRGACDPEVGL